MISLEKYGITESMSSDEKMNILQNKQVEILERIEVIEDSKRKEELEQDLNIIEDAISSLFDNKQEEITALRRDFVESDRFDDLKNPVKPEMEQNVGKAPTIGNVSKFLDSAYEYLSGEKKDIDIALQFLNKAYDIDPHNDLTLWEMGFCYWHKREYDKAVTYYEKSHKYGGEKASGSLGGLYFDLGMFDKSLEWYKIAFDMGNSHAPEMIKEIESLGEIIEISRRACDNDIRACKCLARLLKEDDTSNNTIIDCVDGKVKHVREFGKIGYRKLYGAIYWLQKVIELYTEEDKQAISALYHEIGNIYRYDYAYLKYEQNAPQKALQFYLKAVEYGDTYSLKSISDMYKDGRNGFVKSEKKSMEYLLRYADTGDYDTCKYVGNSYLNGKNTLEKDLSKAIHYFNKAVESTDEDGSAANELGKCYYNNNQHDDALVWFIKAADKGNANAAHNAGIVYKEHLNDDAAFSYFVKAFDLGRDKSSSSIQEYQEKGYLTRQDVADIEKGTDINRLEHLMEAYEKGTYGIDKDDQKADEIREKIKNIKKGKKSRDIISAILGIIGGCVPLLVVYLEYKATNNNLHRLVVEGGLFKTLGIELLGLIIILAFCILLGIVDSSAGFKVMIVTRLIFTGLVVLYAIKTTPSSPSGVIFYQLAGALITIGACKTFSI